ncbi:gliding motility-associated C-terminal domain-containing protein [Arcicella rosea]|uniref:Gliding motility-associated-like protein n=1 Tax=Arcicella rosea TaxID=502909 RepID=A0A841ER16_9BACT|nr:gliding motility-associated C-terminal domain-containing protein [Arcicella rosea]MBB6001881.1 gliding motility-associated-like protein [Arcicella rosea]
MKKNYRIIIVLFFLSLSPLIKANHILGGNFDLTRGTNHGSFTLTMHLYFDNAIRVANNNDNGVRVGIFRKRDNFLMRTFTLFTSNLQGVPFVYDNAACATNQGLNITDITFIENIYLNPSQYDDPQGYYIVYDRCCRNAADNINNSSGTGMLFYLEFPPLMMNGSNFINSSPQFTTPKGEYICKGKPFSFDNSATDADGDQLRYSFVTPYRGFSVAGNNVNNPIGSSSIPEINWNGAYSATSAIPAESPGMKINNQGNITLTATELGLFVYSVLVEEIRNGVVIGQTRRDFQFKVIDCFDAPTKPPVFRDLDPVKIHATTIDFCDYGFVELATEINVRYTYQWQKDNVNLANENRYKIRVNEPGKYTVIIGYNTGCSDISTSDETIVNKVAGEQYAISPDEKKVCLDEIPVKLTIQKQDGSTFATSAYSYDWTRNTFDVPNSNSHEIDVSISGEYRARMTQIGGICEYEPIAKVTVYALPDALFTNRIDKKVICDGESIPLIANQGYNLQYDWLKDDVSVQSSAENKFDVKTSGIYKVLVTDENNCKKMSDTLKLTVNPLTPIKFDTISPFCGTANLKLDLLNYVTPYDATMGKFIGRGVNGTTFSPLIYGSSPITYQYTNGFGCISKITRITFVDLPPKVLLGNDIVIFRGDTITLKSQVSGGFDNNLTYEWSPANSLNNANIPTPIASPIADTEYTLKVTSSLSNCTNSDDILVKVKAKIIVPSGFTPNEDNVNDVWVLEGIEEYPKAEVKIYNRWGGEIFSTMNYSSNPFNGRKDNENLPATTYYYVIKADDDIRPITGYLTIVR